MKPLSRIPLIMVMMFFAVFSATTGMAGVRHSSVSDNWIGASIQSVDSDLADAFELPVSSGVIINKVIKGAPAEKAGLRSDDIVIAFNGNEVTDEQALRDLIAESSAGDKVLLTVMRGDDKKEISVVIAKRDKEDSNNWNWNQRSKGPKMPRVFFRGPGKNYSAVPGNTAPETVPYLGVQMSDLTEQLGSYFGVKDGEGALITEVREDSPAESAGLKAGDVIVKIGDDNVLNSGDVADLISDKDVGDEVELSVQRNKRAVTIKATIGETDASFFGSLSPMDNNVFDLSVLGNLGNLRALRFGVPGPSGTNGNDYKSEMKQLRQEIRDLREEFKDLKKQGSRK